MGGKLHVESCDSLAKESTTPWGNSVTNIDTHNTPPIGHSFLLFIIQQVSLYYNIIASWWVTSHATSQSEAASSAFIKIIKKKKKKIVSFLYRDPPVTP